MNGTITILYRTAVIGLLMSAASLAQDNAGEVQNLKKEVQELKKEIKALRVELKGMRGDITKAVAAMKSGQRPPPAKRQRPAMTLVGKKSPRYEVTTIDGEKMVIGGKRDKPQVVFCYASWCGYCKKSLPWMESLIRNTRIRELKFWPLTWTSAVQAGGRARRNRRSSIFGTSNSACR